MKKSMKKVFRGEAMSYANRLTKLKTLEEQKKDLLGIIQDLYKELNEEQKPENKPETIKIPNEVIEKLKKSGYYHKTHNPYQSVTTPGYRDTGYYIDEPHPEHPEWYRRSGPYHGD